MFSEAILDHFKNPRNAGELPGADACIEVSNPVCGDVVRLTVRLDGKSPSQSARVSEARFLCRGCTTAIACASFLTEQLRGKSAAEISAITAEEISKSLGGLPEATFHGAQLAADAAAALVRKLR